MIIKPDDPILCTEEKHVRSCGGYGSCDCGKVLIQELD
jgi:hypothetical protein